MNDAKREAIRAASTKLELTRIVFEGLSNSNANVSTEKRIELERAYQLARAEFNEAEAECHRVTSADFQPED